MMLIMVILRTIGMKTYHTSGKIDSSVLDTLDRLNHFDFWVLPPSVRTLDAPKIGVRGPLAERTMQEEAEKRSLRGSAVYI